ncbi:hypothetical protein PLICRDRAFT_180503 [Plicaturopsis crispa FD-325 SS-3]|uniref:CxC2-like cysteine cluster KDZ transposase-associated domain-containing protein n=1 Tax=Plicaturopsis crispa FD-325 SS-3 TaxID=944288 RepID=A0A0C9T2B7_PLICR|nr:hypothetical protein PLICRDRAFT_180503 [Plicaturopsis crispa FD-325 SS-3]
MQVPPPPPSPNKRARSDFYTSPSDDIGAHWEGVYALPDDDAPADGEDTVDPTADTVKPRAKRYLSSDEPLKQWMPLRDEYLAELLRLEGRGDFPSDVCRSCPPGRAAGQACIRCEECFDGSLTCKQCCVEQHARNPLHLIQQWNGECFQKTSLHALGLRIQLGHREGSVCANPKAGHVNFVVLHTTGFQAVNIDFCACDNIGSAGSHRQQLLRRQWYPATHIDPQTCCTFRMLENFHMQTLQGKLSMYDYYSSLERLTDHTGLWPCKDRYKAFMRVMREWRHLLMLMRAGRGHAASGVAGTQPGELAVLCPACPRPGVNLPPKWREAPAEWKFLYTFVVAVDACFRLKRRKISSHAKDPGLGTGWAYFLGNNYREYVRKVGDQKEMSTCTGLMAVDLANTKFNDGCDSTGAGSGVCARHEFLESEGTGDLQKGEKYANMDYIFASLMRRHDDADLKKVVSYDIACQWSKHLHARLEKLPSEVQPNLPTGSLHFGIPKLHIHGHKIECQCKFSLHNMTGVGRVCGEAIERVWAWMGGAANSTKEMGPGARHDTLDDQWGFWNWLKFIGMGVYLLNKLKIALPERNVQQEAFRVFSHVQGSDTIAEWEAMVVAYEADDSQPNPYALPASGISEADVRLKLAEEDAEAASIGVPTAHAVTAASFVVAGLEIEDQQRRLRVEQEERVRKGDSTTSAQKAELVERRTRINRSITQFRTLQATYTPAAARILADRTQPAEGGGPAVELAEAVPLVLPSALSEEDLATAATPGLTEIEERLRQAQCRTSLNRVRNGLHVRSGLLVYRGLHIRKQGPSTRARNLVARNDMKIKLHAAKYRAAREALIAINNGDASAVEWPELKEADI